MLITEEMPQSISAEAYKSLRTRIKYYSSINPIKSIVVTSPGANEGKSTITSNLAFSLSQDESKVLIIDCNLKMPILHKKFNISNTNGLSDYINNRCLIKDIIKKINGNLDLICAGTILDNSSEILDSDKFNKLLSNLSINYDYIILDTPPVTVVTDATILAAHSDATLLVVRTWKSKYKSIRLTYDELIKVNANIIGTVLNEADIKMKLTYYKYLKK